MKRKMNESSSSSKETSAATYWRPKQMKKTMAGPSTSMRSKMTESSSKPLQMPLQWSPEASAMSYWQTKWLDENMAVYNSLTINKITPSGSMSLQMRPHSSGVTSQDVMQVEENNAGPSTSFIRKSIINHPRPCEELRRQMEEASVINQQQHEWDIQVLRIMEDKLSAMKRREEKLLLARNRLAKREKGNLKRVVTASNYKIDQLTQKNAGLKIERDQLTSKVIDLIIKDNKNEDLIQKLRTEIRLITSERDTYRASFQGQRFGEEGSSAFLLLKTEPLETESWRSSTFPKEEEAVIESLQLEVNKWRKTAETAQRQAEKARAKRIEVLQNNKKIEKRKIKNTS